MYKVKEIETGIPFKNCKNSYILNLIKYDKNESTYCIDFNPFSTYF